MTYSNKWLHPQICWAGTSQHGRLGIRQGQHKHRYAFADPIKKDWADSRDRASQTEWPDFKELPLEWMNQQRSISGYQGGIWSCGSYALELVLSYTSSQFSLLCLAVPWPNKILRTSGNAWQGTSPTKANGWFFVISLPQAWDDHQDRSQEFKVSTGQLRLLRRREQRDWGWESVLIHKYRPHSHVCMKCSPK